MLQLKMEIVIEGYGLSMLINIAYGEANEQFDNRFSIPESIVHLCKRLHFQL